VAVFGCGNVLLGDDGFGPAVIEQLLQSELPASVLALDVGTSIREHLLDYLMLPSLRPQMLIVVDAGAGGQPGQVRQCGPEELPTAKIHDFSLHQFPTVNLLAELQAETGIEVVLLLAQTAALPEQVAPGLSPPMQAAVLEASARITQLIARMSAPHAVSFTTATTVEATTP
jgi:coenzyme F420 hydrogenase subunit delta